NYPDLLTLLEWTAGHHLEQNALFGCGIIEHLDADCIGLSEVCLQSQFVINFWPLHGRQPARFPLEIIAPRSPAERVCAHKGIMSLTCLGQFARLRDARFGFVALKYKIQKPNDETVRQQNERAH